MTQALSTIRSALAGLALAAISASGAQAATVDVTVDNTIYTIGTVSGTFADNQSLLENQPWWGDQGPAIDFANALGFDSALAVNQNGPEFAYNFAFGNVVTAGFVTSLSGPFVRVGSRDPDETRTYAVVESVAPIPLPPAAALLLGGLGALGLVKRRRA